MIRCDDDSIYTGITTDIHKRLKEHYFKSEKAAKYTRVRNVVSLEALWTCQNRSQASKLEYKIKHLSKQQKEQLIVTPTSLVDEIYQQADPVSLETYLND